jgi:hypothetical protein
LENEFCVTHLNTQEGLSVEHIVQFYKLWEMIQHVHLDIHTPNSIKWKLLGHFSVQNAILGSCYLSNAFHGLEDLGSSQMQDLHMVSASKPLVDSR